MIAKGPPVSVLQPQAMVHFQTEVTEKEAKGAVRVLLWEDLKKKPPKQFKISSFGVSPHKWWMYRTFLDASYRLQLSTHKVM